MTLHEDSTMTFLLLQLVQLCTDLFLKPLLYFIQGLSPTRKPCVVPLNPFITYV